MKKTIRIANLIALVNEHNRLSTCTPDVRHGWNAILEVVLHIRPMPTRATAT